LFGHERRIQGRTAPAAMISSAKQIRSEAPNQETLTSSGETGKPVTRETNHMHTLASEVTRTATAVVSDQAEITAIANEVSRICSTRKMTAPRERSL
jgi:hypothetical protein